MYIDLKKIEEKMSLSYKNLEKEFSGLRAGRANTNMLEPVVVEVYGSKTQLSHIATITVPEARMLSVQVWDKSNVKSVEKAIHESGLGLNPQVDGNNIRVPVPAPTEERRKEMAKMMGKFAETAKVAVRSHRQDAMNAVKKDKELNERDVQSLQKKIQELTDTYVDKISELTTRKEKEIMEI